MKKIITSILAIIAVVTLSAGVTWSVFSDPETVEDNTFATGQMDLTMGNGDPMPFNFSNVLPGDSGTGKVTLTNIGTVNGDLDIKIANFVQAENGLVEPEVSAGDYENGGDLWISFGIVGYVDVNKNGSFDAGDIQLAYNGQKSAFPGFWGGDFHYAGVQSNLTGWDDVMTLTPGQSVDVVLMWKVSPTWDYPNYNQNIIQTDSLGFDLQSSLEQVGQTGGVTN